MTDHESGAIAVLSRRIDAMDRDVSTLRGEFDEFCRASVKADGALASTMRAIDTKLDRHVDQEAAQYLEQDQKVSSIQTAILALSEELKEPMEVYRTAKYGARATSLLVAFVRWAVPVGVGLLIGFNALQTKMIDDLKGEGGSPPAKQQPAKE